MWVPPVVDRFVAEVLWVGSNDDTGGDCWIEVGDFLQRFGRGGRLQLRTYYWAENSNDGYFEHWVSYPRHPGEGAYQEYTIDWVDGKYQIYIGGYQHGESTQPGKTFGADTGLEASDPRCFTGPTYFQNFRYRPWDDTEWYPWSNRTEHQDAPAYWRWQWPEAVNGIK